MSSNDPEQIRADIEATRARLSADVDTLADEANPRTIARRKVDEVKDSAVGLKDRLMGSTDDAKSSAQGTAGSLKAAASDAPGAVKAKAQGNPLAAGVVAFGLGMLVSALIPSSDKEQQVVADLKAKAAPAKEQLTDAVKESVTNLKQPAQDAVASVQETATDGAQNVKAEGQSAGQDVKDQAATSKDAVQQSQG